MRFLTKRAPTPHLELSGSIRARAKVWICQPLPILLRDH